jgi:hypothetical protein
MPHRNLTRLILVAAALLLLVTACAPGNARWALDHRAGFWAGLWHGLIVIVTFVVSLFTNQVGIYETNNVGWGYNLGFILGCMVSLGGAIRGTTHRRRKEPDWDKIGRRIAESVRAGLSREREEADWDDLGRKIEERIREEFKDWK